MFGARGQIDLIDYQSSEYKGYRFLLTYINHGIKFCFCTPIPNKERVLRVADKQPSKIIGLSEEEAKEVIESTRKLLPACQMAEEQARQEQQPQEQEDMDAFRTPTPLPVDLPITSRISVNAQHDEQLLTRNEDQQTLRAYVPDPNLPWDPDTYCAPCKAWWNG
eukprot:jgi/Tetstr1/433009/TSEL_022346.t1